MKQTLKQFIKFGLVGISNTVINYIIYTISLLGMRRFEILPEWNYLVAQVIAFLLSVLWSFWWNNKLVFKEEVGGERTLWKSLLKTYISYSFTGLILNSILLIVWVKILKISELIAPIINLLFSVPINFLLNKFWAFRKDGKRDKNGKD